MKEYVCKTDAYIEDIKIASVGDHLVWDDNNTLTNNNTNIEYPGMAKTFEKLLNNENFFAVVYEKPKLPDKVEDKVNHPSHYTWLKNKCGIEVIDITRHLDFCKGNAVKYLLRAGYKTEEGYSGTQKEIEDLKKAIWYINDRIKELNNGN